MSLCCKIRINRIAAAELGVFFLSFGCLSIFCEHGQVGPLSYIILSCSFQTRTLYVCFKSAWFDGHLFGQKPLIVVRSEGIIVSLLLVLYLIMFRLYESKVIFK